jgi:hypothetical protein
MSPMNRWNFPSACATLTLAAMAGCSAEVIVPGSAGAGSGGTSGSSGGPVTSDVSASSTGVGGGCDAEPDLSEVVLGKPTSGAFIEGTLHLAVSLDEQPEHYLVLKIAGGKGYVVDQPHELDGPANLAQIDAHTWARARGAGASVAVEIVDVSNPAKPLLASSQTIPGTVPEGFWQVFSVVEKHLFTCITPPSGTTGAVLIDVPLDGSGPPAPAQQESTWEHVCSGVTSAYDAGAARGPVWLTWGYDSDLRIFNVTPKGAKKSAEYNYNPDGIHHYGSVLSAATDGERIVFDPASNSEVFLYTVGSSVDSITHAQLGVSDPKRLLGVVGHVAYWATETGVRAYDVTNIDAPKLLGFHADVAFGEGLATLMASDDTRLAVADAEGRLYLIPLGSSGPVVPLKTYLGEPPASSAGPCGSAP